MKKIIVLIIVILLTAAGYGGYRYWEEKKLQEQRTHLTLYGNVEIRRVNLGFRVAGRIESIFFEEGKRISKGELIARLDREPYEDNLAVAAAQVEQARANYEKLQTGSRPQEIEQARATVNERDASLNVLLADYRRASELVGEKVISQQEFETVMARRDEAVARKRLAEENLNLLVEGYRKEEIAAGKAKLSESEAHLKRAQTALDDTELRCPNDGILLTRVEEPGAVVREGQIIATLSLQDALWVYVYVSETDLGKIVPDMEAEIYTDTRPLLPYRGRVGYKSPEAEFTPKTVETEELRTNLVYRVRIIATDPDDGLCQGMPVTVRLKWTP